MTQFGYNFGASSTLTELKKKKKKKTNLIGNKRLLIQQRCNTNIINISLPSEIPKQQCLGMRHTNIKMLLCTMLLLVTVLKSICFLLVS
jgi:hypothetical protein